MLYVILIAAVVLSVVCWRLLGPLAWLCMDSRRHWLSSLYAGLAVLIFFIFVFAVLLGLVCLGLALLRGFFV